MPYNNYSEAYQAWLSWLPAVKSNWDDLDTIIPLVAGSSSVFVLANRTATALEYVRDMFAMHLEPGFTSLAASSISHYSMMAYIADLFNGGEVTMDSILTAMLAAKPTEFTKFIGIVDAYRVALWNAPFNAEFYAALARGFAQWL